VHERVEAARIELDERRAPGEGDVREDDQPQAPEDCAHVEGDAEGLREAEQDPGLDVMIERPAAAEAMPQSAPRLQPGAGRSRGARRERRIDRRDQTTKEAQQRRPQRGYRRKNDVSKSARSSNWRPTKTRRKSQTFTGLSPV